MIHCSCGTTNLMDILSLSKEEEPGLGGDQIWKPTGSLIWICLSYSHVGLLDITLMDTVNIQLLEDPTGPCRRMRRKVSMNEFGFGWEGSTSGTNRCVPFFKEGLKNLTKVYKIQVFRASLILCLVTEQCSGLMGEIKNWNKDEINFLNWKE